MKYITGICDSTDELIYDIQSRDEWLSEDAITLSIKPWTLRTHNTIELYRNLY